MKFDIGLISLSPYPSPPGEREEKDFYFVSIIIVVNSYA
jgi:hypothetical protein